MFEKTRKNDGRKSIGCLHKLSSPIYKVAEIITTIKV